MRLWNDPAGISFAMVFLNLEVLEAAAHCFGDALT